MYIYIYIYIYTAFPKYIYILHFLNIYILHFLNSLLEACLTGVLLINYSQNDSLLLKICGSNIQNLCKEWYTQAHWSSPPHGVTVEIVHLTAQNVVMLSFVISFVIQGLWSKSEKCRFVAKVLKQAVIRLLQPTEWILRVTTGFIQDFSKRGANHLTPSPSVPITNVLTQLQYTFGKIPGVFEQLHTFLLQQLSLCCCLCLL